MNQGGQTAAFSFLNELCKFYFELFTLLLHLYLKKMETDFVKSLGIVNEYGSVPAATRAIDDDETAEKHDWGLLEQPTYSRFKTFYYVCGYFYTRTRSGHSWAVLARLAAGILIYKAAALRIGIVPIILKTAFYCLARYFVLLLQNPVYVTPLTIVYLKYRFPLLSQVLPKMHILWLLFPG